MKYKLERDPLEILIRDLDRLFQTGRMYPPGHEQVANLAARVKMILNEWSRPVRISFLGDDLVVEDRSIHSMKIKPALLTAGLKKMDWEGVRISPEASEGDILAWATHVATNIPGPFSQGGIVAGGLDLTKRTSSSLTGGMDADYDGFLPEIHRALGELCDRNPQGLARSKEIVRSIAAQLVTGGDLVTQALRLKSFDEYTYSHTLNVAVVSMGLAKTLGLEPAAVDAIGLGGLCHDVGKERTPKEVLNKAEKLDDHEWKTIRRHASDGAEILLSMPAGVPPLVPVIAYQHHMQADGSGYPSPRRSFRPHPASLLVAVADVWDALRTVRPYRGEVSKERTFSIMLGDLSVGRINKTFLGALAKLIGVLEVGDRVKLDDGKTAKVVSTLDHDPLSPLVETEDSAILDLADPEMPRIGDLIEKGPESDA